MNLPPLPEFTTNQTLQMAIGVYATDYATASCALYLELLDAMGAEIDALREETISLHSRLAGAILDRDRYRDQWAQQCAIAAFDRAACAALQEQPK